MCKINSIYKPSEGATIVHRCSTGYFKIGEIQYCPGNFIFLIISKNRTYTIYFFKIITKSFKYQHKAKSILRLRKFVFLPMTFHVDANHPDGQPIINYKSSDILK